MQFNKNFQTLPKGNMDTPLVSRSTIHEGLSAKNGAPHDKLLKLTNSMFFEFMKTAYEVNDSFSQHPIIEKNSNEIDWSMLSNIDFCHVSGNPNVPYTETAFASVVYQDENSKECNNVLSKLPDSTKTKYGQTSRESPNNQRPSYVKHASSNNIHSNDKANHQGDNCNKQVMCLSTTNEEWEPEEKHILHSGSGEDNILPTMVKTNLSNILHEGLLDSVLPYMIPDSVMSQSVIKKSIATTDIKKSNSSPASIESKTGGNIIAQKENKKENEKIKINKKTSDTEVEIHVFDEDKNIRKNFRCPQKLLIKKMCYFADVTSGQKLEEMDISVHCDVVIFDWLMRWVKKDVIKKSDWPILEASNVIPIMVSASFLQMEPLLESCLEYCHANISDILKTSSVLTCLDENILTRCVSIKSELD